MKVISFILLLILNIYYAFSQSFEISCYKNYRTNSSVVDDDLSPIFNVKNSMGVCCRNTDDTTLIKVFYNNNNGITFKNLPLITDVSNHFSAYDTSLVAFLGDLRFDPIMLFKQNSKGEFELKRKIKLTKQKKIRSADDIFLLNEQSILLGSTYRYSDYKKICLAKVNIKSKKIEKIIEFEINENEFRFSHYPKQWIAVNSNYIAVVRPFSKNIILLDTSLDKIKEIDISSLKLTDTEKEFHSRIDTAFFNKYQFSPKNIMDYFDKHNILDLRRIERIAFIDNNKLCESRVEINKTKKLLTT